MKLASEVKFPIGSKWSAEYIVVSDTNSKVLMSSEKHNECKKFANRVRDAGGQCTVFKSTRL
jgi:hypothetical protein